MTAPDACTRAAALAGMALVGAIVSLSGVAGCAAGRAQQAPAPRPRTLHVVADATAHGTGTADRPFRSIQPALDAARPGDTVRVGPGSYPGGVHSVRSGRKDARIRLIGERARIVPGERGAAHLLEISNDYLDVSGFDLSGGDADVRLYDAHHVRILGNTIHDANAECVRIRFGSSHNEVAHNGIRNCGRRNFNLAEPKKNGEGVYIGTAPEQLDRLPGHGPDHADDNWIHDNRISTPAECVDIKEGASRTLVEHNTCTGGRDPDSAGFSSRGDHSTFRYNTVRGEAGAGIRLGGDHAGQGIGATVIDNVLVDNRGYGVKIMRTPQGEICGNDISGSGTGTVNDRDPVLDPSRACG
jgi:Right handed beta helix region